MELNKLIIKYRSPGQIIYYGDRTVRLFRFRRGVAEEISSSEKAGTDTLIPSEVKRDLINVPTGLILNPGHFVFNLLTFDKIPFRKKQKNDLVNWRVEKLFPENIDSYIHEFIQFDKTTILSLLVRSELVRSFDDEFQTIGPGLIYTGNSTIEIINNLRNKKEKPDFFIESDGRIMLAVFFRDRLPVYIRKMRSGKGADTREEIKRTVEFVEKNYGFRPVSCSVISADGPADTIQGELDGMNFKVIAQESSDRMFLPGGK